jgi:hypothetical protein
MVSAYKKQPQKEISTWRFTIIYSIPLWLIVFSFPYKDPVFFENQYPFSVSLSGSTINLEQGFSPIPSTIPVNPKKPFVAAIGIPPGIFDYQICVHYTNTVNIHDNEKLSDAVSLEVRFKVDSQTHNMKPNSYVCVPSDKQESSELFVGNAFFDREKIHELFNANDEIQFTGLGKVLIKQTPIYPKRYIFIGMIFTFYPLYWASIIALVTVNNYIYIDKKKLKPKKP